MSSAGRAWAVAASIAAVEALKDQGFCRWNYTIRSLHQHAKNQVKSVSQTKKFSSPTSTVISRKVRENQKAKRSEESLRKVMLSILQHIFSIDLQRKTVRNQTPFESWYKRKPDVNHFLLKAETSLMNWEKLTFIAYSNESKVFRLVNPKKNQLLMSIDVIFDESAASKWEDSVNP
ncbi:DUF3774 DOMAIN PROTEIN-RELATED [Salix koriyanagi]|uniref:DUF3774 DOMAIN PROTEIN-RELATED n=1 Tax=Salix koriyanagi TaxID=2511006 RepID=A0A9Q0WA22_9ROSI|nr:DUF3774 DOMAIN PROTEIN-RELATED [Salix koriyanagi]